MSIWLSGVCQLLLDGNNVSAVAPESGVDCGVVATTMMVDEDDDDGKRCLGLCGGKLGPSVPFPCAQTELEEDWRRRHTKEESATAAVETCWLELLSFRLRMEDEGKPWS